MVIEYGKIKIVSVLFSSLIVLGSEIGTDYSRGFVVDIEREGVGVGDVFAALPVELGAHGNLKLGIVVTQYFSRFKIYRRKIEFSKIGVRRTVEVCLVTVVLRVFPYNLIGGSINNLNIEFFSASEKSGKYTVNTADTVCIVRNSCFFLRCGNCVILGFIHLVNVTAQRKDVVIVVSTQGGRCVIICFDLVFVVNSIVVCLGFNLIEVKVKDRSLAPIAIEGKERSIEVDAVLFGAGEGQITLNIHTVFKRSVKIALILSRQCEGYVYLCGLSCRNRNHTVYKGAPFNAILGTVGKQIRHFCYVLRFGSGYAFGHSNVTELVGECAIGKVGQIDAHLVDTRTVGVILELKLGLIDTVNMKVCGSRGGFCDIGNTCPLFSGGIRVALLVERDGRGRHGKLVIEVSYLGCGKLGEGFLFVLTDQDGNTAHIGSSHTRAAQFIVFATNNSGKNIATVRSDFGFEREVRVGTPR